MYRRILWAVLAVVICLNPKVVSAQQPATELDKQSERERYAALEKSLTGAALIGNFTVTGQEKTELTSERYELQGVRHLEGELWMFQARIRYGEHDVTLPLTLPIRWAGDTPVICIDKMGFPGLGVYTARVMIYDDHYSGFWSGDDHGGHLFGIVEKAGDDRKQKEALPKE